jgi:cytochrome b561
MQYIVLALIGLHVGAALWHHFIVKDPTLRRMM